mmetsp:Transcript_19411/g.28753  ORF Transcript_19411/g.28753 Transcript_19411/m.28753 type:complete len:1029 (+) Transcript_19411:1-3087(+)
MDSNGTTVEVDESLYSRQLYVMGREAQKRMAKSDVLILGANGLGVEVAKNVILAGVKKVTLKDTNSCKWEDLSAQFYLTEKDIGKPRAKSCIEKLAELNRYVKVCCIEEEITPIILDQHNVVVLIDVDLKNQIEIDDYCHEKGICFISADVRGVFASVFCDFGLSFYVSDKDDAPASSCLVCSVTQDNPALVTVMDDNRHGLETGSIVTFSRVEGMVELENRTFIVTEKSPYSFEIDIDSTHLKPFVSGYVNEIKQGLNVSFKRLRDAILDPEPIMETDFAKFNKPGLLHQGFRALHEFKSKYDFLPEPGNASNAEELINIAKFINSNAKEGEFKCEDIEKEDSINTLKALACTSRGIVSPMCALIGGIVGQEVLKACSGKFMPIKQWLYFDSEESLPDLCKGGVMPPEEVQPQNCRYDGQIMVFGKTLHQSLLKQSLFLVGAGAIGCEMLKNWALMGIGSSSKGSVRITDMDHIEKSNLSRQFLFRKNHIGKPKSVIAAEVAKSMNPDMNIIPFELKCAKETENVFCDEFYENLTGICNALDNVEARLYMDQKSLFYKKPMFESGTLGTKGNTQIVIPYMTENYGASRDPPEKSIPVCTLKNFPNQIEHTLQWARDWFEGEFTQTVNDAKSYLTNQHFESTLPAQPNLKLETYKKIEFTLIDERPKSFDDCVAWARICFQNMFYNTIAQLLHNFPVDSVTSSGTPFWTGAKRPPIPLVFDPTDPLHLAFISSASNLRASIYKIENNFNTDYILSSLERVLVPDFAPADGVKIAVTDAEAKENRENGSAFGDPDLQCKKLVQKLSEAVPFGSNVDIDPIEFDKDLDEHMVLVASASNLRARCYKIPEADIHKSKLIAGKIIPAIATTTALVTGLVCLEIIKFVQEKPLEAYKNWFLTLSVPYFTCSEPLPPTSQTSVIKGKEWKWSAWDCIDVDKGDMKLSEFFDLMKDEYGLEVSMVSYGVSMLYSFFGDKRKIRRRMDMTMTEVIKDVNGVDVLPSQKYLIFEVCAMDIETQDDVDIPYIRFKLQK